MSSKQLPSPRKSKKRSYRRRIRNKRNHTDTNIIYNEDTNERTPNIPNTINTDTSAIANPTNIPSIAHSRTLSYLSRPKLTKPRLTRHENTEPNLHSPISPMDTDLPNMDTVRIHSNNFLSFDTTLQNLSVSLPSSPVNHNSKKSGKNINKLSRVRSMNERNTPITRIKTNKKKRKPSHNSENMRVMIRFRPFNKSEMKYSVESDEIIYANKNKKVKLKYYIKNKGNQSLNNGYKTYSYKFDRIFDEGTSQKTIFDNISKPICDDILQFKSNYGTIFCYGQSGSGKTFTMFGVQKPTKKRIKHRRCSSERINNPEQCRMAPGDIENMGMVRRSCCYIFDELSDLKEALFHVYTEFSYNIYIECVEIYNEKLKDLLNSKNTPIIREIKTKNKYKTEIQNVTRKQVKSINEIVNILQISSLNRNIHCTSLNETSSRSHMVIRVIVKTFNSDTNKKTESILSFIDLAGSENIKKTKNNHKKQVFEAGNILKSLTTLSQVIDALIKNKKHIPYKDSKLTRILQNSLGGNCKTALLICASPHIYNRYETIRSLKFGIRCQQIKNYINYDDGEIVYKPQTPISKPLKLQSAKSVQCMKPLRSLTLTLGNGNNSLKLVRARSNNKMTGFTAESEMPLPLELSDNPSVIIRDVSEIETCHSNKDLQREIERLNSENDLLRAKDELSENVSVLNQTISKIALQNAFKRKKQKRKRKKTIVGETEGELNIFQSKLIQITIGLNAKIEKIKELISDGLELCEDLSTANANATQNDGMLLLEDVESGASTVRMRDNDAECEGRFEDDLVMVKHKPNTSNLLNSINFNQKIYSETMVQELKQQNEQLLQEIHKLKSSNSTNATEANDRQQIIDDFKLVKTPRISSSLSTNYCEYRTPTHTAHNTQQCLEFDTEENDTYYICDDEDVYQNVKQTVPSNNTVKQQTLSEQLSIMEKMRVMDKNNLDCLQSPMSSKKFDGSHRVSPRDSITLLKSTQLIPSLSSSKHVSPVTDTSSTRSSINSQSVLSTTIESIDEHLEKWNNGINVRQGQRLSTIDMYNNRRRSSVRSNTQISVSLSTNTNTSTSKSNHTGHSVITPNTLDLEQSVTTYNDIEFDDPILKEENEEDSGGDYYDYYSDEDNDDSYYNNCGALHMHRTKTDSIVFRNMGLELSKKLKAKSVESPCQNGQRLSSTFAAHWINIKSAK